MNPARQWLKKVPRQPLRSPLPSPKLRPWRRPWRLRCRRPTLLKVRVLHERILPRVVVVAPEGSTIPEAVSVEGLVPVTQEATGAATEPAEVASGGAPAMAEEEHDEVLPESNLEVVVRSLEIQDAEPIRSAPMSGTATTSRGGIELLADDLVDLAVVARNLEAMHRAEQWVKICYQYPWMVDLP
jgi:hypothetical protein